MNRIIFSRDHSGGWHFDGGQMRAVRDVSFVTGDMLDFIPRVEIWERKIRRWQPFAERVLRLLARKAMLAVDPLNVQLYQAPSLHWDYLWLDPVPAGVNPPDMVELHREELILLPFSLCLRNRNILFRATFTATSDRKYLIWKDLAMVPIRLMEWQSRGVNEELLIELQLAKEAMWSHSLIGPMYGWRSGE